MNKKITPVFLHDFKENGLQEIIKRFWKIEHISEDREIAQRECDWKEANEVIWEGTDEEFHALRLERQKQIADKFEEVFGSGAGVLFAVYKSESYSGYAFVLFEKDGVLYEVNGSHCSCYGLEGQWMPEETTLEALEHRLNKGTLGLEKSPNAENNCFDDEDWADVLASDNIFANELRAFIQEYREANKTPTVH